MEGEFSTPGQFLGKAEQHSKRSPWTRLRTTIMAGLTVLVPLWITGWVLWTLFKWADGFSTPLIQQFATQLGYPQFYIPGLGFLLTFAILWIVGIITTNVVGRHLVHTARDALARLPVVRLIYPPLHKLLETVTSPDKTGFKQVVLVEYPRQGLWALGFVTAEVPQEDSQKMAYTVFLPTTPNPTTGFVLIVPPEQLRYTSISLESAFQMIISGGVVTPSTLKLPAADRKAGTESPSLGTLS